MNRILLILLAGIFAGIQSYSQSTYPININTKKEKKSIRDFLELGLELQITTNAIDDQSFSNSFSIKS